MSSYSTYGSQGQGEKIQPRVRLEGFNLQSQTPQQQKPTQPPTPQDILSQFTHSSPHHDNYASSYSAGGGAGSYPRSFGAGTFDSDLFALTQGLEVDMDAAAQGGAPGRFDYNAANGGEQGVSLSAINEMMINLNHQSHSHPHPNLHHSHSHSHSIPTRPSDDPLASLLAHPSFQHHAHGQAHPHPSSAPEPIPYSLDSFFTHSNSNPHAHAHGGMPFPYGGGNGNAPGVLYQPVGSPISTQGYSTQSGSAGVGIGVGVGSLGRQGPGGQGEVWGGDGLIYGQPGQMEGVMSGDGGANGRSGRTSLSASRGASSDLLTYPTPPNGAGGQQGQGQGQGQRTGRSPSSGRRTSFNDNTTRSGQAARNGYPNPQARLFRRSSSSHRNNPMSPAGRGQVAGLASPRANGNGGLGWDKYLMPGVKKEPSGDVGQGQGLGISAPGGGLGDSRSPIFPQTIGSDESPPGESETGAGSSSSGGRGRQGREGSEGMMVGMKEDSGMGQRDWRGEMMAHAQQAGLVGGRVMSTVDEDGVDDGEGEDDGPLPPNSLSKAEDALARKSRRRLSHNEVERRRREVINEKIQELETLLPAPMIAGALAARDAEDDEDENGEGGADANGMAKKKKGKGKKTKKTNVVPEKLCKGTVLCLTVDLVRQMTHMLEVAQAREQEMSSTVRNLRVQMATMASNPSYGYTAGDVSALQMGYLPGESASSMGQGMDELRTLDEGGQASLGAFEGRVKDEAMMNERMSVDSE